MKKDNHESENSVELAKTYWPSKDYSAGMFPQMSVEENAELNAELKRMDDFQAQHGFPPSYR